MNLHILLLDNRLAAADHQPLTPPRLKRRADDIEDTKTSQDKQPLVTSEMTLRTISIEAGAGTYADSFGFETRNAL
jgi:hypothetical protein